MSSAASHLHYVAVFSFRQSCMTVGVMPGPVRLSLARPITAMPVAASVPHLDAPAWCSKRQLEQLQKGKSPDAGSAYALWKGPLGT